MFNNGTAKPDYSRVSLDDFSDDSSSDEEEAGYNRGSAKSQQQMLQEQDHGLELLSQSADRLGQLSMGISEELSQQNRILDSMDEDLEQTTTNLDFVTVQTKELIARSGGKRNCILIAALTLVAVILFFLILYA